MKKGDIVTIQDFSWSKRVTIEQTISDCTKRYVVVEVGCILPLHTEFGNQPYKYRSDTIIRSVVGNEVILIHGAFLRSIVPAVKSIREVTMAEVCAQFGEEVKIKKD